MSHTDNPEILQLPRDLRRGLRRGARLDAAWFAKHKNQSRVAYLRRAIAGEDKAFVAISDLPQPRKGEVVLIVVVRIDGMRVRKPLIWRGKLPPMDREDVPLALALHEPGPVSIQAIEATVGSWPHAVLERFGISNSTLNNWIKAGRFPAPIELGPNVRAWLEEELDAVVERSVRQRDAAA
jgi:predicted DNA-binding transcriptional regulator AlpA